MSAKPAKMNQFPDLYKLPPMEFQSFDDWNKTLVDENHDDSDDDDDDVPGFSFMMDAPSTIEPVPDYSDNDSDENNNDDLGDVYDSEIWNKRRVEDNLQVLSKDEYEDIVAAAEAQLGLNIPEPDYQDDDRSSGESPAGSPIGMSPFLPVEGNESELITPRKLRNPNLESKEKQDLHRELLMNSKLGVDVLHKKSELKKKLEQRRDEKKKKEFEEYQRSKRSSLEVRLEQQASKLKQVESSDLAKKPITEEKETPEFLRVHSKINRKRSDS